MSTISGILCNSWMTLWVMLELNSLSMAMMMNKEWKNSMKMNNKKENMKMSKPAFMYVTIQMLGSVVMISTMMSNSWTSKNMLMIWLALVMKMGAWPIHSWYLKLLESMKMSMLSMKMILTWQKILPMTLMVFCSSKEFLLILGMMSILAPSSMLKEKMKMKLLIVMSSINNTGWLIVMSSMSMILMWSFTVVYSLALLMTMSMVKSIKNKNTEKKNMWESIMMLSNMSGMPPMLMFSGKMMVLSMMMVSNMSTLTMLILMIMTFTFVYMYLCNLMNSTMMKMKKNLLMKEKTTKMTLLKIFTVSTSVFIALLLSYT